MRIAAIFVFLVCPAWAQFKTTTTLVIAPTTVVDAKGNFVDGLDAGSLVLYDNNVKQPIQVDEAIYPISLAVAIQTSASSAAILDKLGDSGILFSELLAGDAGETAILTFSDEVRVRQDFTGDPDLLQRAMHMHVQGNGSTTLEGVMTALRMLSQRQPERRRIILMIAEKRDRSSKVKLPTVLNEAQRENVLIYWLTYSPFLTPFTARPKTIKSTDPKIDGTPLPPDDAPGSLLSIFTELGHRSKPDAADQLSSTTGGRAIGFLKKDALEEAVRAIGAEVHRQYILSFQPAPAKPGQFHSIRVAVKDRPDLKARTRAGYWTVP
jgi:VWFA-related protein